MAKMNKVCVNIDQTDSNNGGFTDAEKAQARANIGAGTGTSNSTIVHDSNTLPQVTTNVNQMTIFNDGRTRFDNLYSGVIPSEPSQSESGRVLVANYAGSPGKGTAQWKDVHNIGISEVPSGGSNGQVLTWNSGNYGWANAATELPAHTSAQAGKALILNAQGEPIWDDVSGGSSITMSTFKSTKTINIPAGNSSMLTDTYKVFDLAPKTAVNMTLFVCDMDRNNLAMMGISIWCGTDYIGSNGFTRGTYTEISHAIPVCYYNSTNSPIEIKIGFNGTFAQQALDIAMMGFTITQGV